MSSFPKRFGAAISVLVATRVKTGGKGIRSLKCFRIVNQHDLDRDFAKEGPDYTRNKKIGDVLSQLQLQSGEAQIAHNLHRCYEALIAAGVFPSAELELVELWLKNFTC